MRRTLLVVAVLCAMLAAASPNASAQSAAAKVYVAGGEKPLRLEVIALLRASTDIIPVGRANQPEANISLQKNGDAKVKCGSAQAVISGRTAADIVALFRTWLPAPLAKRRAEHQGRARAWSEGLQALAGAANAYANANAAVVASELASSPTKLMLFGGDGHRVYLGCLNCGDSDVESVTNRFGDHGSRYASASIFNRYSDFGGPYGTHSPCNRYAIDPPVIVDGHGAYYGRLTISATNPERTRSERWQAWIAGVCAGR